MTDEVLKSIDHKLGIIIKLIAISAVKGRPMMEQVEMLDGVGLTPVEIATCLGKTPNNIRVTLHTVRKKVRSGEIE